MTDAKEPPLLSHSMLSDRAYELLQERIIHLQLQPGQRLNLDRLARELGVSPTPLRDALRRLAEEDLVTAEPFKGFQVSPLLDEDELQELAEVRSLMEQHAVQRRGARPESVLDDLRGEVALMDELIEDDPPDIRSFNGADARFHTTLVHASGNPTLERSFRKLNAHVQIARLFIGRGRLDARTANAEHHRIVAALAEGDLDKVRTEIDRHIMGACERVLGTAGATQ